MKQPPHLDHSTLSDYLADRLAEAERSAARDQLRREREGLLEDYDKDGDGRLSPAEREEAGLPQRPRRWRRSP